MQESEELLFIPQLHWMYAVRHAVWALPFFIIFLLVWIFICPENVSSCVFLSICFSPAVIKCIFPAAIGIVLVLLICSILQFMFTEYGITNKRLIIKKGVIRISTAEIPTDRIESIYCIQGLLGRLFGYGTICVSGVGGKNPAFYMVARPFALRRRIIDIIEKNKTINVVQGDLPKVIPVPAKEKKAKEEPAFRYGTFVRVVKNKQ